MKENTTSKEEKLTKLTKSIMEITRKELICQHTLASLASKIVMASAFDSQSDLSLDNKDFINKFKSLALDSLEFQNMLIGFIERKELSEEVIDEALNGLEIDDE